MTEPTIPVQGGQHGAADSGNEHRYDERWCCAGATVTPAHGHRLTPVCSCGWTGEEEHSRLDAERQWERHLAVPAQGGQDTAGVDLAAIKARCDAVPLGPWEVWRDPDKVPAGRGVVAQAGDDGVCITDDLPVPEAEFIACARSDLPAVLDLNEQLTAENRALRERLGDTGAYDRVLERTVTAERRIGAALVLCNRRYGFADASDFLIDDVRRVLTDLSGRSGDDGGDER